MAEMAIPEDIRAKAETIAEKIDADWSWDGLAWPNKVLAAKAASVKAIAQAILAEQERQEATIEAAREFVKRHPALTLIDLAEFEAFLKVPEALAAAIRRQEDGNG